MQINIEKRHAIFILIGLSLLAGSIYVYAYANSPGVIPNPGHELTSVQGLFSGDANLNQTLSTKFCQSDGTNCQDPVPRAINATNASWSGLYGSVPPSVFPEGMIAGWCLQTSLGCNTYYRVISPASCTAVGATGKCACPAKHAKVELGTFGNVGTMYGCFRHDNFSSSSTITLG